jgi:hypothetical protein
MNGFPDTSFLCALDRTQIHSARADQFMAELSGTLGVSSLLLLEFRQSVRLQIRLHLNDRTKGFPHTEGQQMLNDLQRRNRGWILRRLRTNEARATIMPNIIGWSMM